MDTPILSLGDNKGGYSTPNQAHLYQRNRQNQPKAEEAAERGDVSVVDPSHARYDDASRITNAEVGNAVSYTQTQKKFLQLVEKALDRMTELTALCQDTSKSDGDRARYTTEFTELQNHISDIGTKKFNGASLFVSSREALTVQVAQSKLTINSIELNAQESQGGLANLFDPKLTQIADAEAANSALERVKVGIANLGTLQSAVAANIQKLNLTSDQIAVLNENLSAANLRIKDVDLAKKLTEVSRSRILKQPVAAMLAQAHAVPESALRLLS
jgi:flagellin